MFQCIRTRLALSLAIMAVAAMSVAPAYAAPSEGPGAPPKAPPQVPQSGVQFKPDLSVKRIGPPSYLGVTNQWVHHFTITNVGAADSGAIALKGTCRYLDASELLVPHVVLTKVIGGLKVNHSTNVDIFCGMTADEADGAMLSAGTQDDLDPENNGAVSY